MSWEAWGSDEPPSKWEETRQRQEFDAIVSKWEKWRSDYAGEDSIDDADKDRVSYALDALSAIMQGPL